ncbi:hypothetical protein OAL67_00780 [bacterium]|nr:hypothetical protein [bacterium]
MALIIEFIYLFGTVLITFLIYPIWIDFVYKFQMGEEIRGDGPKTHLTKRGTPTMGGLVFVLTVALITFGLNRSRTQTLFPVFVASLAGLLGLLEDFSKVYKRSGLPSFLESIFARNRLSTTPRKGLWRSFKEFWRVVGSTTTTVGIQTHQKFLIQGLIGGFVAYWVYFKLGWDYLWFPLVGNIHLGFLYPLFIFVLFIVVLNSVAFSDGLDGLVGGLALFAFIAFWVLSHILGYHSLSIFCATFVGALIPFLYFNVYPARIFMGNVGSHVLGATLAVLAVVLHREVAFLFIGLVFLVDGISSPLQSLSVRLTKKRFLRMAPLHHHFELMDWPETKVVFRFWLFGIFFAFVGVCIALL